MKSIYLIQRARINKACAVERPIELCIERLSHAVNFDYMGSAEFEFGALPASFREFQKNKASWVTYTEPRISNGENALMIFHCMPRDKFEEEYMPQLLEHRKRRSDRNSNLHTKEATHFSVDYEPHQHDFATNFWWDIENHVMFSFNQTFMNNIQTYVNNSLEYMDAMAAKK